MKTRAQSHTISIVDIEKKKIKNETKQEQSNIKLSTEPAETEHEITNRNESENKPIYIIQPSNLGDISPLGYFAFGMTTILNSLQGLNQFENSPAVYSTQLFMGGLMQFVVGLIECIKGNSINAVILMGYGFYNLSSLGNTILSHLGVTKEIDSRSAGYFNLLWSFFAFVVFLGSIHSQLALILMNGLSFCSFFFNIFASFFNVKPLKIFINYICIAFSCISLYIGYSFYLNIVNGRTILPLGEWYKPEKKKKRIL